MKINGGNAMNKNEILYEVRKKTNVNRHDTELVFDAMVEIFGECFENETPISIRNVGSFKTVRKPARKKYIPVLKEERFLPPKKTIKFTPSQALLDSVNKESEENEDE